MLSGSAIAFTPTFPVGPVQTGGVWPNWEFPSNGVWEPMNQQAPDASSFLMLPLLPDPESYLAPPGLTRLEPATAEENAFDLDVKDLPENLPEDVQDPANSLDTDDAERSRQLLAALTKKSKEKLAALALIIQFFRELVLKRERIEDAEELDQCLNAPLLHSIANKGGGKGAWTSHLFNNCNDRILQKAYEYDMFEQKDVVDFFMKHRKWPHKADAAWLLHKKQAHRGYKRAPIELDTGG